MNRLFVLLLAALIGFPVLSQAQHLRGKCGFVENYAFMNRLKANKLTYLNYLGQNRGAVTYVPLNVVIGATTNGAQTAADESEVLEMVCKINEDFASQDIQFYIYEGISYFNNDAAYQDAGQVNPVLAEPFRKGDAIDLFISQNPEGSSGLGGTTLGYYSPSDDWLVIRGSEVNGNSETTSHELGHYFSLAHPFRGWDCEEWDEDTHGVPLSSPVAPCQVFDNGAAVFVDAELMDGSNCETAGDLLCDTPPDYNLGFGWPNCNYTGPCQDFNGTSLNPMETNMMGYFLGCTDFEFTPMQQALIKADLEARAYLNTDFTPPATDLDVANLSEPAEGTMLPYYTDILFVWDEIAGADRYLLEIDLSQNFNIAPIRLIVYGFAKYIDELSPNQTYYWRVKPFNSYQTCTAFSERGSFTTGTIVNTVEIGSISNWDIFPNPVQESQDLYVRLDMDQTTDVSINLLNINGAMIETQQTTLIAGENNRTFSTAGLSQGVYLVEVVSPTGKETKRVVIQ